MTNFQYLKAYAELQKDIMFDELRDIGCGWLCYNRIDPSPFWNNVITQNPLTISQLGIVETELTSIDRKPAVFFINDSSTKAFSDLLEVNGYRKSAEDSLMFHDDRSISEDRFDQVKKVQTSEDLTIFMKIFDQCYRADDPKNPYGELGEYIVTAKLAWEKHQATNRLEYFIAYKDEQPVAVASLTNHNGMGYLSNIGSLMSVRGQGFGKVITNFCVSQSIHNGNRFHFLATEAGTNPNSFYASFGFKTRFTAKLMVKN